MAAMYDLNLSADGLASELGKMTEEAKRFAKNISELNDKLEEGKKQQEKTTDEQKKSEALYKILNKQAVVVGSSFNSVAASVNRFKTRIDNTFKNEQINRTNSVLLGLGQAFTDLRNRVFSLQRELSTTFASAFRVGAKALTNVVTSFFTGGPTLSFQDSIDAINAYQKEFGGLLTRGEAQKIAQASKDLGVSATTFLQAQRSFLVVGGDVTKNTFIGQFRAAGLTAANALEFAAKNANLVAIAGVKYAGALAQAAANAQRIGVGLDRTEALADGIVGNFEGALERFSELRAMGVEVDFNRLAAVAGTGTPQEVLSELQSQLGGNQRLLAELQRNRFLKVALEQDLGLNVAEITRLASGEAAKPTEQTEAEKQSGLLSRLAERIGTVLNALGLLNFNIFGNTVATGLNTLAMRGPGGGGGGGGVSFRKLPPTTGPALSPGLTPPVLGPGPRGMLGAGQGGMKALPPAGGTTTGRYLGQGVYQGPLPSGVAQAEVVSTASTASRMSRMAGGARMGAAGGAGLGVLTGIFSGVSEYKESGSIGRAIAKGLASMLGSIIGGMLGGALSAIFPPLAPVFIGVGSIAGAYVADKLVGAIMGSPKAMGGLITGPGTATSDNILTPTSPGEFVVNAAATKAYGVDMLQKINNGSYTAAQAPQINNVVNVNMERVEAKLDKLASVMGNIRIEMDGNTVGRASLNSRSPIDHLAVV